MTINVNDMIAGSTIQGFGYDTSTSGTLSIATFSLGAGATTTRTLTIPIDNDPSASLTLFKVSGCNHGQVNNKWLLLNGSLFWRENTVGNSYDTYVLKERTSTALVITIQFYNPTGSSQTIQNLTVNVSSYFYSTAW